MDSINNAYFMIPDPAAKERNNAQQSAMYWHDFLCWLKEDKDLPIDKLLNEFEDINNSDVEASTK